jgi:hypothetical protein
MAMLQGAAQGGALSLDSPTASHLVYLPIRGRLFQYDLHHR